MYIDASAIVAIVTQEPEAARLAALLKTARAPITSATAIFEAAAALTRKHHAPDVESSRELVMDFLAVAKARTVGITSHEADIALEAFAKFGKGRGHPAQLNMGDCFGYAVARSYRAPILFKGEDFNKTDAVIAE
jgi:ribonuclease VapC